VLFDSFAAGTDATRLIDLGTPRLPRYQHIEASGHYDQARQNLDRQHGQRRPRRLFRDNAVRAWRGGGWVLVNRGWGALGERAAPTGRRSRFAGDTRRVRGRADNLPSPGIQLGTKGRLAPPYPVVAAFPTHAELSQLLGESSWTKATDLVLLDPAESDGYVRRLGRRPDFPPMRHIGYAVQWFALALTPARHLRGHQLTSGHGGCRA